MAKAVLARVIEAGRKRWLVFDAYRLMTADAEESDIQLIRRWIETHGAPSLMVKLRGGVVPSADIAAHMATLRNQAGER